MDPYSACFCGSGEKYKFCCQKAESQIFRVENLVQSKQIEAAIKTVQEAIKRFPDLPMLILQKAAIETQSGDLSTARLTLEAFLAKNNRHAGGLFQYISVINLIDGPHAAANELQRAIGRFTDADKNLMHSLPSDISAGFLTHGFPVAALGHQRLALIWSNESYQRLQEMMLILSDKNISLWLRNIFAFKTAPEGISAESAAAFEQALILSDRGQWHDAIEAFEMLKGHDVVAPATFNRAVLYSYLGDNASAISCFRAYIGSLGETEEAVDLEAFCQTLALKSDAELEDSIKLSWPIRSREQLIDLLDRSNRFVNVTENKEVRAKNGNDDSQVSYILLDKPFVGLEKDLTIDNAPCMAGNVVIDDKYIALTACDDGRLDEYADLLRDTASSAIVPAHPRTKHAGKLPKPDVLEIPPWFLPEECSEELLANLRTEYYKKLFSEILPDKPLSCLGGLTIEKAAAGQTSSKIAARALFRRLEVLSESSAENAVIEKYRAEFNLPKESIAKIRPISEIHITRLKYVDLTELSLPELPSIAQMAANYALNDIQESILREIITRAPQSDEEMEFIKYGYIELSTILATSNRYEEARRFIQQGQDADPDGRSKQGCVDWELAKIRSAFYGSTPVEWAPHLASILEEYVADQVSGFKIFQSLLRIGLLRRVPDPENPGKLKIDSSILDYVMQKFVPKTKAAQVDLGVSVGQPQIWTPGSDQKQGGSSIWTPGQTNPDKGQSGAGSKLIIPGR